MKNITKKISIITVNFNQPQVTEQLLQSIQIENDYADIEIVVVDNGSNINHVADWQTKYPFITFIRSEVNTGFAGGNNIGINASSGEYLFLVNNDTEFTPGLVSELRGILDKHTEVGMVSPKIRYYQSPDILQYAGYTKMNYYTARNNCIGQFEKDNGQYDHLTGKTGFAHGAAMMIRRDAMQKVGLMKENYFLYYEELDWCERFKKQGYTIWVNMQALIYHKESVSVGQNSPLKEYFMNRNRILFERRNAPFFQRQVFFVYFMLLVVPRNIYKYLKNEQAAFIKQLVRSIWWNLKHSVDSKKTGYKL